MTMKAIKLKDNLIIVSDEKIEINKWMYNTYANAVCRAANDTLVNLESVHGDKCLKIAASFNPIEGIPSIQFANEEIREKLMGVGLQSIMVDLCNKKAEINNTIDLNAYGIGIMDGLNAYKELNSDKLFTLEEAISFAKYGYEFRDTTQFPEHKFEDSCINNFKQYLQSLQQPKEFSVEGRFENGNFIINNVK